MCTCCFWASHRVRPCTRASPGARPSSALQNANPSSGDADCGLPCPACFYWYCIRSSESSSPSAIVAVFRYLLAHSNSSARSGTKPCTTSDWTSPAHSVRLRNWQSSCRWSSHVRGTAFDQQLGRHGRSCRRRRTVVSATTPATPRSAAAVAAPASTTSKAAPLVYLPKGLHVHLALASGTRTAVNAGGAVLLSLCQLQALQGLAGHGVEEVILLVLRRHRRCHRCGRLRIASLLGLFLHVRLVEFGQRRLEVEVGLGHLLRPGRRRQLARWTPAPRWAHVATPPPAAATTAARVAVGRAALSATPSPAPTPASSWPSAIIASSASAIWCAIRLLSCLPLLRCLLRGPLLRGPPRLLLRLLCGLRGRTRRRCGRQQHSGRRCPCRVARDVLRRRLLSRCRRLQRPSARRGSGLVGPA
mmetsp:Transcript_17071/g.50992  ORF Transcript_17071/g.50992 Transcript_17071/m.50992 type:complete len:417 (+) Transcript_17071:733-1983(+)